MMQSCSPSTTTMEKSFSCTVQVVVERLFFATPLLLGIVTGRGNLQVDPQVSWDWGTGWAFVPPRKPVPHARVGGYIVINI